MGHNGNGRGTVDIVQYNGSTGQVAAIVEAIRLAGVSSTVAWSDNGTLIVRQFYRRSAEEHDTDEYSILPTRVTLTRTVTLPYGPLSEVSDLMTPEGAMIRKRGVIIYGTSALSNGFRYQVSLAFPPPSIILNSRPESDSPYSLDSLVVRMWLRRQKRLNTTHTTDTNDTHVEKMSEAVGRCAKVVSPASDHLVIWRGVSREVLFD